jgi:hypothetical protein
VSSKDLHRRSGGLNFDAALTFIRSALTGRTSKATFLHGSFGTGKSHFMSVLERITRLAVDHLLRAPIRFVSFPQEGPR